MYGFFHLTSLPGQLHMSEIDNHTSRPEPDVFRFGIKTTTPWADGVLVFVFSITSAVILFRLGFELSKLVFAEYRPMFGDFISFWTASFFVLDGLPAQAYDYDKLHKLQIDLFGQGGLPFMYPPTWLLVISPFSALSYNISALLFEVLQVIALVWACLCLARQKSSLWILIAFPAVMFGVMHGQNTALNVALLGGALAALDRDRPVFAGVLIGLLSYKPQMGVLIPIALLASRDYRVFVAASVSTVLFAAASWLVLGTDVWRAFFDNIEFAREWLESGQTPANKYASILGWLRQFGVGNTVGMTIQVGFACLAAGAVVWVWRKDLPLTVKGSVLVAGTCLTTPYLLDYDLGLLVIAVLLLIKEGNESGYLAYEKAGIAISTLCLLFSSGWGIAMEYTAIGVPVLVLFGLCLRRAIVMARRNSTLTASY